MDRCDKRQDTYGSSEGADATRSFNSEHRVRARLSVTVAAEAGSGLVVRDSERLSASWTNEFIAIDCIFTQMLDSAAASGLACTECAYLDGSNAHRG